MRRSAIDDYADDYADDVLDFTIPQRHQGKIQRPLQHVPIAPSSNATRGFVLMEFNHTIYRKDICIGERECKRADLPYVYREAIHVACVNIRSCVMRDIEILDEGRFDHDA